MPTLTVRKSPSDPGVDLPSTKKEKVFKFGKGSVISQSQVVFVPGALKGMASPPKAAGITKLMQNKSGSSISLSQSLASPVYNTKNIKLISS